MCIIHINDGKGGHYIPSYISGLYGIIIEVDIVVFLFSFTSSCKIISLMKTCLSTRNHGRD